MTRSDAAGRGGKGASSRGQYGGARAAALASGPDGMRGPKIMALAVMGFFGSSLLAIHLVSLPGGAAAGMPSAGMAPAAASAPVPAIASARPPSPPPPRPAQAAQPPDEGDLPGPMNLGIAPVPAPGPSADRERKLNACIERKVRSRPEPQATAPGRWPALKKAREAKRLQRLEARAACERELGS